MENLPLNGAKLDDLEERDPSTDAQARLAAIVTSSEDAIVSKTLKGIVTSWNVAAERIFGYSAEEMIGQSILRLIPPELHDEEVEILARLKRGERIEHYETIRMTKDQKRLPVSLTISPIKDDRGNLLGASKIARDISSRRVAEEKLRLAMEQVEAASRAKDNFLAALSHELRTPLTPVLMTVAALREDDRLPEEIKAQLGMIERNVVLEARLIDDLLDLSRITHGKLELRSEPCDAHSIIGLVIEIIRDDARAKGIRIALKLAARHNCVTGDPARLQQVFWNLLRNAVKFTPKGGHIRVCSHDEAGADNEARICLTINDDGIGLDTVVARRIFEPFEQAAPGQTCHRGGLGLGLAIARNIVDLHGGAIRAESPGPGKGSTFTVELPATIGARFHATTDSGEISDIEEGAPQVDRVMRLLVVEDHEPTLQVLTRLLHRRGHSVVNVGNLTEARAAAAREPFDAVISDLGLPDGTGIELMEELRDRHGLRGIALSGYGMEHDLRRSRKAGFAAHLVKPVDVNELHRALRQLSAANASGEVREVSNTAPGTTSHRSC